MLSASSHTILTVTKKIDVKETNRLFLHIIRDLHVHVQPFTKDHYDFDIIGNFYGEFIRYTGGDGKGLGIVLTPKHITDLFAELAKPTKILLFLIFAQEQEDSLFLL